MVSYVLDQDTVTPTKAEDSMNSFILSRPRKAGDIQLAADRIVVDVAIPQISEETKHYRLW